MNRRTDRQTLRTAPAVLFAAGIALGLTLASAVQAQLHIDVSVQENVSDGRLSIHGFDFDVVPALGIVVDKRAFVRGAGLSGNSILLDDPGFVSRTSATELSPVNLATVASSEALEFNILSPPLSTMPALGGRTISFWDGTGGVSWGPAPDPDEGIEIIKGSFFNPDATVTVLGGTTTLEGFSIGSSSGSGSLHEHLKFLLLPDNGALPPSGPDDGVYLMLLEATYAPYAEWVPFFLGLEAFAGGLSTQAAAETAITANLLNPLCSDGIDNDKDGAVDFPEDAGCTDANDMSERGDVPECDNGIDDDGDGFVDFHDLDGDGVSDGIGDSSCLHRTNAVELVPEPAFGLALSVGAGAFAAIAARRRRLRRA